MSTARAALNGRFEITRPLGEGGFGIVYEALDRERNLRVALKTLKRLGSGARDRFRSEFRGLADLTHPNLPLFFELFTTGDEWFFTMELVEGPALDAWVRGEGSPSRPPRSGLQTRSLDAVPEEAESAAVSVEGTFSEARLRAVLPQLRSALGFLHAHGQVHRDVKPSNVRVREDGRLFLLDFGLAGRVGDVEAHFVGTPAYAAPEQIHGGAATPAVDAYALGSMVFELVTGRLPFPGTGAQMLLDKRTREAPGLRTIARDVPEDLAALVDGWLERDPERRAPVDCTCAAKLAEPFVGRERELQVLRDAFDAVLAGDTRVVLIEGESGIGKTSLVERALDEVRARSKDVAVLVGRPSPKERVPFNAFEGVLPSRSETESTERAAFQETALETLGTVARRRPTVLWIDDLQWADDDSRELLVALLRPPQLRPALFILSKRPTGPGEAPLVLPCARHVVNLGPLDLDDAAELARAVGSDESKSKAVALRSGGHPLFLQELSRARSSAAEVALDDVLAMRIAALPESQRELLVLLSMSQVPLAEGRLARASGRGRGEVARDLELLRRSRLARVDPRAGVGFRTYHDRVREVAADALGPAERKRIHEALLEALDGDRDLSARLEHLVGAERHDEAAQVAREAAQEAAAAGAYVQAATLLGDALQFGELAPDEERAMRVRRVELFERAHRGFDAGVEALRVAEQTQDTAEAEAWRMRAARLYLAAGHLKRGREVLRGVLERAGMQMPSGEVETLLSLVYHRVLARWELRSSPVRSAARTTAPERQAAREYALLRAVADGFSMTDHARGHAFQSRALRAAIASRDPTSRAEAMLIDALYVGSNGQRGRVQAERSIAEALAPFVPGDEPPLAKAWVAVVRATLEKHERPSRAVTAKFHEAETQFLAIGGDSWVLGSIRLVRGHNMRLVGDLPSLRAHARKLVHDAEARKDLFVVTTAHLGSILVWLADDAPLAARQVVSQVSWPEERGTFLVQHWLSIEAEVEIALYEGSGPLALERMGRARNFLRFSLLKRLQSVRICCNYTLGRALLAALEGGRGGWLEHLELRLVMRALRREHTGYAAARASLLAAGLHAVRGAPALAAASLVEAERLGRDFDLMLEPHVAAWLRSFLESDSQRLTRRAAAERALAELGVKAPRRFVRALAPGFERWLPPEPSPIVTR